MPIPVVKAVIRSGRNILYVRETGENFYKLPGGRVESDNLFGELTREIREEVGGIRITGTARFLGRQVERHPLKDAEYDVSYWEFTAEGNPHARGEIEEIRWVPAADVVWPPYMDGWKRLAKQ